MGAVLCSVIASERLKMRKFLAINYLSLVYIYNINNNVININKL